MFGGLTAQRNLVAQHVIRCRRVPSGRVVTSARFQNFAYLNMKPRQHSPAASQSKVRILGAEHMINELTSTRLKCWTQIWLTSNISKCCAVYNQSCSRTFQSAAIFVCLGSINVVGRSWSAGRHCGESTIFELCVTIGVCFTALQAAYRSILHIHSSG